MGIDLYVGGHASRVQGEAQDLGGKRMFTAAHPPQICAFTGLIEGDLDSGAFTDVMENKRLTYEAALDRQLAFERKATEKWGKPFQARRFVSYDRLIDEKWVAGKRIKERWDINEAESAVEETVAAAQYLDSRRDDLTPRGLILSCQGVDAFQYQECVTEVLKLARLDDCIGLGGWCILGKQQRWMPTFWQTLRLIVPMIARAGVRRLHIFGVLFQPALGGLLWLADQHKLADGSPQLTVSTDSTAPILACTWKNWKKAGARERYWRDNVAWWQRTLANLRTSDFYKAPPTIEPTRQECFL